MKALPSYPEKWPMAASEVNTLERTDSRFPLLAVAGGLLQSLVGLHFCFASYAQYGDWLSWLGCGAACGVGAMCVKELVAAVGFLRE
jgi:hypothetical protein